ncbi:gamma-glutamyl phosphate reductase [Legionella antarctica]|uniref:Gamma-glutamyl phosphate reductase n=1 Tax=Legionella antarctica TaxID=2708020 RepID=A0A6F8T6N5_9GAMM|nr:glutamate-5-semialdehyde dehydrogenase [Legionella antarctica]BCA95817.1 gamma-glutamyl phosphate reductase [Legionella antarctica]
MDTITNRLKAAKETSHRLKLLTMTKRKEVLLSLAANLRKERDKIIAENKKDLLLMEQDDSRYDRLLLSEERINAIADDVELVASLPDPLGAVIEERVRPNGLRIQKVTVPLGVVAVIYESRPNVTIDVFCLCFITGNACVLKGGKEAYHSNNLLKSLIHQSLEEHNISKSSVYLLPADREATHKLLNATSFIDVCIPRGSKSLIQFVREHAKIPVIETGAGIVHLYFDSSGDIKKGRLIITNAKTRRVSVCNALDTLIINKKSLGNLYFLVELLGSKNVEIYADALSYKTLEVAYPKPLLHQASANDFGHEFLSYKMAIKTVSSVKDAVNHIMEHTSGHSEAIIAEEPAAVTYFLDHVDAAAVYVNASTAFTDGGQFGMGAEIGISTQKLHARGPMGLAALTSYKWLIFGDGQIRA